MTHEPLYKISMDTNVTREIETAKKMYKIFYYYEFMREKGKKISRRNQNLYLYSILVIIALLLMLVIQTNSNTEELINHIMICFLVIVIVVSILYFIVYFLSKYSIKRMYNASLLELEKPFGLISNTKEIYVWEREIMVPNIRDDITQDDDFIPLFLFDEIEKVLIFDDGFIMINRYQKKKKKVLFLSSDIEYYQEVYQLVINNLSKRKIINLDIEAEFLN